MRRFNTIFMARQLVVALSFCLCFQSLGQKAGADIRWVGSWGAAQQIPEPQNALPEQELQDATLRQIVHLSLGGNRLRIRLSNAFGTAPLHLSSVHIARATSASGPAIESGTDVAVTFAGRSDVTIPAGAEYTSDPVPFAASALSDLALSMYLASPPQRQTGHPGSRSTSYVLHGDQTANVAFAQAQTVEHWYQIAEVDVAADANSSAVVVLGDSITDGHGATTNGNDRWPDVLSQHLQSTAGTRAIGVLNVGIGGNRVLLDGLGPNAAARFDRDVLARSGARYLIVLEGVNDLGTLTRTNEVGPDVHADLVRNILLAYQQMVHTAHEHNMLAFGATILPYGGSGYYHPGQANEADRQAINQWIRSSGTFDAVLDFDMLLRDPQQPDRLLPAYDSGDHLHPSPAGYRVMGNSVPLGLFSTRSSGARSR